MKIRIHDFEEASRELVFEEPTTELNALLDRGPVHDFRFAGPAAVRLEYYRSGADLFLSGRASVDVCADCARCLEQFTFRLDVPLSFVLVPRPRFEPKSELGEDDLDLSYYEGEEVDVSPLMGEQLVLALPTQPLCGEGCKGLCQQCGANLNAGPCGCREERGDPRLAVLRGLKVDR